MLHAGVGMPSSGNDNLVLVRVNTPNKTGVETMVLKRPEWRIPLDLQTLIDANEHLTWETDDWSPIGLTVMGGISHKGRDIHQFWQIEYEPVGCDGYDMSARIAHAVEERAPDIFQELNYDNTEQATLVISVESETTCKRLMNIVWEVIHET